MILKKEENSLVSSLKNIMMRPHHKRFLLLFCCCCSLSNTHSLPYWHIERQTERIFIHSWSFTLFHWSSFTDTNSSSWPSHNIFPHLSKRDSRCVRKSFSPLWWLKELSEKEWSLSKSLNKHTKSESPVSSLLPLVVVFCLVHLSWFFMYSRYSPSLFLISV